VIAYRTRSTILVGESWYALDLDAKVDILRFYHLKDPPPEARSEEYVTIWINLARPEEEILKGMNRTTRYEIRRAAESGLVYAAWFSDAERQIDEFCRFYAAFAEAKHLPAADRRWLELHASCGALDLSRICDPEGNPLSWHASYRDSRHVRLRYSASIFRAQPDQEFRAYLGRANRLHHWEDFRRYRRESVQLFDFGGWYPGTDNKELLRVNDFKQGFGGEIVKTYDGVRAMSWKGRLYLWALDWRKKLAARH